MSAEPNHVTTPRGKLLHPASAHTSHFLPTRARRGGFPVGDVTLPQTPHCQGRQQPLLGYVSPSGCFLQTDVRLLQENAEPERCCYGETVDDAAYRLPTQAKAAGLRMRMPEKDRAITADKFARQYSHLSLLTSFHGAACQVSGPTPRWICSWAKRATGNLASPVCSKCENDRVPCVRAKPKARFKHGSAAKYDSDFPKDQTWLSTQSRKNAFQYVDETESLRHYYSVGSPARDWPGEDDDDGGNGDGVESGPGPAIIEGYPHPRGQDDSPLSTANISRYPEAAGYAPTRLGLEGEDHPLPQEDFTASTVNSTHLSAGASNYGSGPPSFVKNIDLGSAPFASPSPIAVEHALHGHPTDNVTEAVLLRYFIENLARWFELCDPSRHFRVVVPARARDCPALGNAILTSSARHLTRTSRHRGRDGILRYEGRSLPDLNTETALHHHNECIKDLLNSSLGSPQMMTEDFIAAAIILRFHEEVDAPLRDEEYDTEIFRQVSMTFFKTQPDVSSPEYSAAVLHEPTRSVSDSTLQHSPPARTVHRSPEQNKQVSSPSIAASNPQRSSAHTNGSGLLQAAYWVALRQEIHFTYLNQRALHIPLPRDQIYRSLEPANDEIWSKRLVVFCADTLDLC